MELNAEATKMQLYRRILRLLWSYNVINDEFVWVMYTKGLFYFELERDS